MMPSHPLRIDFEESSLFAVHHCAADRSEGRAPVLICAPWGWDDVASYRARRDWAMRLAAGNHPTLRFDLPATGNSSGAPGDPHLLELWLGAIGAAAVWLADDSGVGAVYVLGLGLGCLLALAAARRGAPIEGAALWGAPGSGRRFLRETRAFSAMQPWNGAAGVDQEGGEQGDRLEAGGFSLAPETVDELGGLAVGPDPGAGPARVLAFDRDGIAPDSALLANLAAGGAAVEQAAGPGWGEFVSHPERSQLPLDVAGTLERWLDEAAPRSGKAAVGPGITGDPVPTGPVAGAIGETPIQLTLDWGSTVGVLTEPAGRRVAGLGAVFLDAGAVRSVGPSRLWTETARRWAGVGLPSVRIDLEGIGDADGPPAGTLSVGDFYRPHYVDQLGGILDGLQARGVADRFVLVGLCSGGYWAFRRAVADPRVIAVFGINSGALRWDDHLLVQRQARARTRALESEYWRRLVRGEVGAEKLRTLARSVVASALHRARGLAGGAKGAGLMSGIESDLDALAAAGVEVLLAFSGREPLAAEIEAYGLDAADARWPQLEFASLPGEDHTLRSLPAQRALRQLLDGKLENAIARAAVR